MNIAAADLLRLDTSISTLPSLSTATDATTTLSHPCPVLIFGGSQFSRSPLPASLFSGSGGRRIQRCQSAAVPAGFRLQHSAADGRIALSLGAQRGSDLKGDPAPHAPLACSFSLALSPLSPQQSRHALPSSDASRPQPALCPLSPLGSSRKQPAPADLAAPFPPRKLAMIETRGPRATSTSPSLTASGASWASMPYSSCTLHITSPLVL
jgi:hypothetical protein